MKIIKIWSIVILTLSIGLLALCVLGSLKVVDVSPTPINYMCLFFPAVAAVITLRRQKSMEKAGVQNKSRPGLIISCVVCMVAIVLGFAFAVKYYSFTAEGAAEKRLAGEIGELLCSQSLSEKYSVFVFSQDERYETLLVKKRGFAWYAEAYMQITAQDGPLHLLSFKHWPDGDGKSTFIALQCRDERVAFAEIGSYRVAIEDEITVLTVGEELSLQDVKGEAFDESGNLLYRLVPSPAQPDKYMDPIWEAA